MTGAAVRWPSAGIGRAATVALLVAGIAVEIAAGAGGWRAVTDWAAGASLLVCAEFVPGVSARRAVLLRATAVAWFAGTLAVLLPPVWAPLAQVVVLAYRGPLLHVLWLTATAASLPRAVAVAAGYLAPLSPAQGAVPVTTGLAIAVAGTAALHASRAPGRAGAVRVVAPLTLAAVWASAAAPVDLLLVAGALAVAGVGVHVVLTSRAPDPDALGSLAVRLGPTARREGPVTAVLARLLGDPRLRIRFEVPGGGWVDEEGSRVGDPTAPAADDLRAATTIVAGSSAGRVALLHGRRDDAGTPLAVAAAAAAALVLDSATMAAEEVRHAQAALEARERLLGVADAERGRLARRLEQGPRRRVAAVRARLEGLPGQGDLVGRLDDVLVDLHQLGEGLYPSSVLSTPLHDVLARLAADAPVAVDVVADGDIAALDERQRVLVWFVCSECLANVVRHAQARRVVIRIGAEPAGLTVSIEDDGRGGASPAAGRGLAGLADRVAATGGTLTVHSPAGGPTRVTAHLTR